MPLCNPNGTRGLERLDTKTSPLARATASALAEFEDNPGLKRHKGSAGGNDDVDSVVSWTNESRKNSFELVLERARRAEESTGICLTSTADICKRDDYHSQRGQHWKEAVKAERPRGSRVNVKPASRKNVNGMELPSMPQPAKLKYESTSASGPSTPRPDKPFVPGEVVVLTGDKFFKACHVATKKTHVQESPRQAKPKENFMSGLKHFFRS